jgi:hypothetical protein
LSLHREPDFEHIPTWECRDCGTVLNEDDVKVIGEGLLEPFRNRCVCGTEGAFVPRDPVRRDERSMAKRWGEHVAACGWTATPNVLLDHLGALGLDTVDVTLLALLERHRMTANEQAWPSRATLARLAGKSEHYVGRRLGRLVARGLIERHERPRRGGHWPGSGYTRSGLTRALQLIAANRRAGKPEDDGLAKLLDELDRSAPMHSPSTGVHPCTQVEEFGGSSPEHRSAPMPSGRDAPMPSGRRAPVHAEEEVVEEEEAEEDSAYAAREQARAATLAIEHAHRDLDHGAPTRSGADEDAW